MLLNFHPSLFLMESEPGGYTSEDTSVILNFGTEKHLIHISQMVFVLTKTDN